MKPSKRTFDRLLRQVVPNLFAQSLGRGTLGDFHGAIAGSLASIPQTLAYGLIIGSALGGLMSGVGVLVALYGSMVVGLMAALLGGSPFLVAGPRASTLLVFSALIAQLAHSTALAQQSNPAMTALILACAAAAGSGLLQLLFGAFRLGRLAHFVPLPVLSGFLNASALLIILSQIGPAIGIGESQTFGHVFSQADYIKPTALLLSLATIILVRLSPHWTRRVPALLLAFACGTAVFHILALFGYAEALGGTLPPPPENFTIRFIGYDVWSLLTGSHGVGLLAPILVAAFSMAILSSLDTLLAISATDAMTLRRSHAGRQLMAEGFGNLMAGLFGMAPGSSAMVRTQAALNGGMNSVATPVSIALITLAVTLLLGPAISFLPQAVMSGLMIALGIDLFDRWTIQRLRRMLAGSRIKPILGDLAIVATVVSTALVFGLAAAVGVGILLSVLAFVTQMSRNPVRRSYNATALIPRIIGDHARYRFIESHGTRIAIVEIEGALFFGTASELESCIDSIVNEGTVHVVLDFRRVKHVDATGGRILERIHSKLMLRGGMLAVSHVDRERRQDNRIFAGQEQRRQSVSRDNWLKLSDLGTIETVGETRFLHDTDAAVTLCEKHLSKRVADDGEAYGSTPANNPFAYKIDRPTLRRLRPYLSRTFYARHEVAFTQGSVPDGAYFVVSGRVDVIIDLPGTERKRKVQSLTCGSVFGEMALIDPQPRSATIVAAEATSCYWMSSTSFDRLKREHADIAFELLGEVAMTFAERLRATNTMLAEMEA